MTPKIMKITNKFNNKCIFQFQYLKYIDLKTKKKNKNAVSKIGHYTYIFNPPTMRYNGNRAIRNTSHITSNELYGGQVNINYFHIMIDKKMKQKLNV